MSVWTAPSKPVPARVQEVKPWSIPECTRFITRALVIAKGTIRGPDLANLMPAERWPDAIADIVQLALTCGIDVAEADGVPVIIDHTLM